MARDLYAKDKTTQIFLVRLALKNNNGNPFILKHKAMRFFIKSEIVKRVSRC